MAPPRTQVRFALLILTLPFAVPCPADDETSSHSIIDASPGHVVAEAALARTKVRVRYDGTYRTIDYPGGDVANNRGVCSDVVIRAYRKLGIDLQERVHLDMTEAFDDYPDRWGLKRPDSNIDHRRVPNLERFFTRKGAALSISKTADFRPGDIVSWRLPNGAPHIGIVQSARSADGKRPLIVHNIGRGPMLEDSLFSYTLNGHFRYAD